MKFPWFRRNRQEWTGWGELDEYEEEPTPPNAIQGFFHPFLDVSRIRVADRDWEVSDGMAVRGQRAVQMTVTLFPHSLELLILCPTPQALMLGELRPKKLEFNLEIKGDSILVTEVFVTQHAPTTAFYRFPIVTNPYVIEQAQAMIETAKV